MKILVLNCGSSSVKFAVIDTANGQELASGLGERLGSPKAQLRLSIGEDSQSRDMPQARHTAVLRAVVAELDAANLLAELAGIGHRVVHGGEKFTASAVIDDDVISAIEACVPLGPLHNPANLEGIRLGRELLGRLPQVAVFDTSFHQSMPPRAWLYPVPYDLYEQHGVRRYGFHGTSHRFVASRAAELLDRPIEDLAMVTAHLGNGCSAAAVLGGRSVDTTMGLTPLEGLVMGTRSGDVDPALHGYLGQRLGWSVDHITTVLNKQSGLLGISGVSNDMRTVLEAAEAGNQRASLAVEVFVYRLAKSVAALSVALGRLDALVFTGGVGENSALIRSRTLGLLGVLGLREDAGRNANHGRDSGGRIGTDSSPAALVVATNEEWMIALDTAALIDA